MIAIAAAGSTTSAFEIPAAALAEIDALCEIDRDASALFAGAGLDVALADDHVYSVMERTRWLRSLGAGQVFLAVAPPGRAIGFAARAVLDGEHYLDQLSVRTRCMRQGAGSALLRAAESAARTAGSRTLWLTTYNHLPWNRPFYERAGFVAVSATGCGQDLLTELTRQRRWLPRPEQRIVMKKALSERDPH